jgi:pyruvate dehydrogenase E2 component (dihydrolipoamide acetyltransferase)
MSDSVQMPALGESVTEGTVTRWLKQVGDRVEVDEPLLEVSTDKVDTEIPSPFAGVVEQIIVAEDETVDIGAQLAVIGDGSGASSAGEAPASAASPEPAPGPAPEPAPQDSTPEPAAEEAEPAPASEPGATTSAGADADGTTVSMPALGESVTEGTITRWLKQEGEQVAVDEPLLEVSTDKVDTEIPSPVAGTLKKILVGEDETVEVGAALAIVGSADASPAPAAPAPADQAPAPQAPAELAPAEQAPAAPPPQQQPAAAPPQVPAPQPPTAAPAPAPVAPAPVPQPAAATTATASGNGSSDGGPGYVTPLVRRMASERNIDLSMIKGTGVGGRIRKQDVIDAEAKAKAAQAAAPPVPAAAPVTAAPAAAAPAAPSKPIAVSALRGTTEKMSRLRKVIAQRMVSSLQTSAQLTTVVEVDVTRIARLRDRAKTDFAAREGVKLSFLPFFALAAVEALKQHPKLNASIEDDDTVVYHAEENLGVAVDTERGLLAPVIHGAGDLNIAGLARKITDLADRTRKNKITPDELGGGTFTLTNTGSRGALFDTPILFLPQTAILGTGVVVKRPVAVQIDGADSIAIRSIVYLALSYDHRLVDGADAARFLVTIKERLEEGAFEADLGL